MYELINVLNDAITQAVNDRNREKGRADTLLKKLDETRKLLDIAEHDQINLDKEVVVLKKENAELKDEMERRNLLRDMTGIDADLSDEGDAEPEPEPKPEQVKKVDVQALLDTKLEDMDLHSRAYTLLSREGIKDLRGILDYPALDGKNTTYKFTVLKQFANGTAESLEDDLIYKAGLNICAEYHTESAFTLIDDYKYWNLCTSEELIEKFSEVRNG